MRDRALRLSRSPAGVGALTAAVAFAVYLGTVSPTVTFIDAGELAAVASTVGIAHPTGYPLFTLIGRIVSMLPLGGEEIARLNLLAALLCAAGVFVFFRVVLQILKMARARAARRAGGAGGRGEAEARSAHTGSLVASAGASLALAVSETYWLQATAVEVYSLHLLLVGLTLLAFLQAAAAARQDRAGPVRGRWYLGAFLLGLGFTNHMTTILLVPGLAYLFVATSGFGRPARALAGRMLLPFALALSLYLVLPLRASQGPLFSWGNPVSPERLLWHIGGKQYRVWIFSSSDVTLRQLTSFLESLPGELGVVALGLAAVGVVALWRFDRHIAVTTLLLFVTCVAYAVNYDIHDIDSYFLLAYMMVAVWCAAGLFGLWRFAADRGGAARAGVAAVALAAALLPAWSHWRTADQSGNYLVEDYAANMFAGLEPEALVLSFQWDYWVSASYYYQYVRGFRRDVAVVDKELLRRSWYLRELERRIPWLIRDSRQEVEAFLAELDKFEHDLPYNPAVIQGRFEAMINSFVRRALPARPVYVTPEIGPEFTKGLQRVPAGLAFRVREDSAFRPTAAPNLRFRPLERRGRLEDGIRSVYAEAFLARAQYYGLHGEMEESVRALRQGLTYDPGNARIRGLLAQLGR